MISSHFFRRYLYVSTPHLVRRPSILTDPGAAHQTEHFKDLAEDFLDDPEGFGDLESDFMEVHKSHREHERDLHKQSKELRQHIIKHKYFRTPQLPNLLTYAEKEQMRTLHTKNPEEWSIEKLAESFPATPDIVKKVLEAKWRPNSVKRVRAHDEAVIRNWEQIRTGQYPIQLPPELNEHLKKFTARKLSDLNEPSEEFYKRPEIPKPKKQEFLSIISSCSKYADKKTKTTVNSKDSPLQLETKIVKKVTDTEAYEDETYLLDTIKDKREMRLEDLKRLKLTPAELESSPLSNQQTSPTGVQQTNRAVTASPIENPNGTGVLQFTEKFESSEIVISAEDQKRFEMTKVKDRVHIPRRVWRKGATYRVEDAYYDDDGEFLYRVPGMTR